MPITEGLGPVTPSPAWTSANGDSALYLGDALDILSGIPEETVDCVWTDPPYKLSNGGITCFAGRMVSVDKGEWDRSGGLELDHQFNLDWIEACRRVLKPTGSIWVSGTFHSYPSVGMALLQNGFRLLNDITWQKPNPPPNLGRRTFTHSTETLLWASKAPKGSRDKYTFHYDVMREENGGKQMQTVWRFPTPTSDEKTLWETPDAETRGAHRAMLKGEYEPRRLSRLRKKGFRGDVRAAGMSAMSLSDALPGGLTACGGPLASGPVT